MSFRTNPLPSYEDIISGAFLEKGKENRPSLDENLKSQESKASCVKDTFTFKYRNVPEEGEIPEEGELTEVSRNKKRSAPGNDNISNNTQNVKKIKNNKQKPVRREQGPNFSSNTTDRNATATSKPSTFVPRLVCRYFMEGICSKGDKCTFSHSVVPNKTIEEARVKDPCKFFIMGSCMKGDACYFSHDLSVVPCKFFHLRGECAAVSRGLSCRFSHSPIDKETLEKLRASEIERVKEKRQLESSSSGDNVQGLSAPEETPQTCNETEKSTACPHDLNPFAFYSEEEEEKEEGACDVRELELEDGEY